MERAGAQIDHVTGKVTRSVGEFGQRAGEGVDQAGRSVGATAQRAGTRVHDKLAPSDPGEPPKVTTDGTPPSSP